MNKTPGQQVRAAGILLMSREAPQQFLLMRHKDRWDLPKGHCDAGETFCEAALRETREETGIPAAMISLDPDFCFELIYPVTYKRWPGVEFEKRVQYFLGFLDHQPPLVLTEHESARWFDWDPPHAIQSKTIDPLLHAVAAHLVPSPGRGDRMS